MKNRLLNTILLLCCFLTKISAQTDTLAPIAEPETRDTPVVLLDEFQLDVQGSKLTFKASEALNGQAEIEINGEKRNLLFKDGTASFGIEPSLKGALFLVKNSLKEHSLHHIALRNNGQARIRRIPLWLSILPPLIAIVLALVFKEVLVSLFLGIWVGAFIAGGLRIESLYYLILSFLEVIEKYIVQALNDSGHLSVIIFSLLIGGMVAIISRNGGMAGVVLALSKYARSPRSTQFITWLLGVAIFFDDYANTLIVGNTMRSVSDRFKISREKLAYIVDSTAAPVAAIAFITTWIGAELGYIGDSVSGLGGEWSDLTPYSIFISSLKYSFYPVLTLSFILILIYTKKDYGPMYQAEYRARSTGKVSGRASREQGDTDMEDLSPVPGAPLKWFNAVIPVAVVILMTLFGLVDTGMSSTYSEIVDSGIAISSQSWGATWAGMSELMVENNSFFSKLGKLIGNSDSYVALLWASLSGVLAAILLTLGGRIMKLAEIIESFITGFKTMLPALIILTLAWSLAITTEELHTATFLTANLQNSINPYLMPAIVFILAAAIAFSTGSSWSTMAILYPIAIPLTWGICEGLDPEISREILLNVIATVLAASVLGDHCSPISDTTILSSLASDCNHIDHVRTQLPYALTVGTVSLIGGSIATFLGGGWLLSLLILLLSLGLLYLIVQRFGKTIEQAE